MNYINVDFPKIAKYVRYPNRVYFPMDPENGELLTYNRKCDKPYSNARGFRWYKRKDGSLCLVRYDDIVELQEQDIKK